MNKLIFAICFVSVISIMMLQEAKALSNPWVDCKEDMRCGERNAGFDFPLQVENYTVRAMKGMFELRFSFDTERQVVVRKALKYKSDYNENGIIDISGDYNVYPINKTITLENGAKLNVKGSENNYKVVIFATDTEYYSIVCDKGLQKKDIEKFYALLKEAESSKYKD